MLIRSALIANIRIRYYLLCELYLNGYIKQENHIKSMRQILHQIDELETYTYDYLLILEENLSRIEDNR